jgi:hypothetical protein
MSLIDFLRESMDKMTSCPFKIGSEGNIYSRFFFRSEL